MGLQPGGRTKLNLSHARSECTVSNFSLNFCHMPTCNSLCFLYRQMTNDVSASYFPGQTLMRQSSVVFMGTTTHRHPSVTFIKMQHSQVLGNFLLPYAMLPELLIDDYHNGNAWPRVKSFIAMEL